MATPQQVDNLFNDYFRRNKGRADTLAWAVSNNRDRGLDIERRLAGLIPSLLTSKVKRHGSGAGTTVDLGTVLAYDKDNQDRQRRHEAATAKALGDLAKALAEVRAEVAALKSTTDPAGD